MRKRKKVRGKWNFFHIIACLVYKKIWEHRICFSLRWKTPCFYKNTGKWGKVKMIQYNIFFLFSQILDNKLKKMFFFLSHIIYFVLFSHYPNRYWVVILFGISRLGEISYFRCIKKSLWSVSSDSLLRSSMHRLHLQCTY